MNHPGNFVRIQGPYTRPDGRKHMIATREDGRKTTISYPKYLKECELGRLLLNNETVDHFDRDKTNDCLDNLKVIDRPTHAKLDAKRRKRHKAMCACCKKIFKMSREQMHPRKKFQGGPFCSPQCRGKGNAILQHTGVTLRSKRKTEVVHGHVNKDKHLNKYK